MKAFVRKIIIILFLGLFGLSCEAASLSRLRSYVSAGERYVNLKDMAAFYGFSISVPPGRKIYLRNKWNTIEFENDSRNARINGIAVWLHAPLKKKSSGSWAVTETDVHKVIDPILRPLSYLGSRKCASIVLDPGHGGTDQGASSRHGVVEKKLVLDIAKRVRVHLATEGLKVYLTREGDQFVELEKRSSKASRWGADIFVSIHLNSATTTRARGVETYALTAPGYPSTSSPAGTRTSKTYYSGNNHDRPNTILGYFIQRALAKKTSAADRGLRRARFMVLKNTPCVSALVECGFVSNGYEESRLKEDKYREVIAQGIAKGILDYINAVKKAKVSAP